ncbi:MULTISPECIES: AraC family ligand binding domain-containing protein [Pantoea]|uniref:AraC family ligand binding domain-containing protein n=1 Tax=Pantoea TaxID=53335 RepID=UPI00257AB354|nr:MULTISPECIES: AraC family ligand binding domain-containing protein [Pantoea]
MNQASANWIDLRRDAVSGIEALRAHFTGHAWDPHWHDSYLIGVTEQGVQQFHSRRKQHQSRPGMVFMLEPEELHDGDAINHSGFTYRMLYHHRNRLRSSLRLIRLMTPCRVNSALQPHCATTAHWLMLSGTRLMHCGTTIPRSSKRRRWIGCSVSSPRTGNGHCPLSPSIKMPGWLCRRVTG